MSQANLKRILNVSSALFAGTMLASLSGVLVVSIITKNITVASYGIIVMLQAYVMFVDQLFNFQSWQALIKYSSVAIHNKNKSDLVDYLKLGIFMDICGSALAFLFSLLLLKPLSHLFHFGPELLTPYLFYAVVILFRISGTPTALIRLTEQYKYFNYQQALNWGGKLIFISVLAMTDLLSVQNILIAFAVCESAASVYLILIGIRVLKKYELTLQEVIPSLTILQLLKRQNRFLKFALRTNINSSVLGSIRTLDELIIGAMIGPSSAAIFKVMKLIATVVSRGLDPLYTVIYPEFSKLVAEDKHSHITQMIRKITSINFVISTLIATIFYFFGQYFVSTIFTADYLWGLPMMHAFLACNLISFVFFYIQPLMLSLELEAQALTINTYASIVYISLLYLLVPKYELWAIVISFLAFTFMVNVPKLYLLQRKKKMFF